MNSRTQKTPLTSRQIHSQSKPAGSLKLLLLSMLSMAMLGNACIAATPSELDANSDEGFLLNFILKSSSVARLLVSMGDAGAFYTSSDAGERWSSRTAGSAVIKGSLYTGEAVLFTGQTGGTTAFVGGWTEATTDGSLGSYTFTTGCATNASIPDIASSGSLIVAAGNESSNAAPCAQLTTDQGEFGNFTKGSATAGIGFEAVVFDSINNEFIAFTGGTPQIEAFTMPGAGTAFASATPNQHPFITGGAAYKMGAAIAIDGKVIAAGADGPGTAISAIAANVGSGSWITNAVNIFGGNGTEHPRALAYNNSRLVAVGDACRYDYTDDVSNLIWLSTPVTMNGCSGVVWEDLVWTGKYFVAVGQNGGNAFIAYTTDASSPDSWTISQLNTGGGGLRTVVAIF